MHPLKIRFLASLKARSWPGTLRLERKTPPQGHAPSAQMPADASPDDCCLLYKLQMLLISCSWEIQINLWGREGYLLNVGIAIVMPDWLTSPRLGLKAQQLGGSLLKCGKQGCEVDHLA